MAAHLVVPFQQQQQQQQHQHQHQQHHQQHQQQEENLKKKKVEQEAGPWSSAPSGPPVAGWQMAWSRNRSSSAAAAEEWEVRAFAEDAASCSEQWPPRSYSCSFCAREFRTAQALGGHMNVHRRERAYANQLGLLRSSSNSAALAPHGDSSSPAGAANSTPGLGLCWLYPVPAPTTTVTTSNNNISSSTVTTASPHISSVSRMQTPGLQVDGRTASNSVPVVIDRKKMMQENDPNVDLELRLGQAL